MISVTLSRNETKSQGKDFVCYEHIHTLEYLDTIQVNSNTVLCDIYRNIKGVKQATNKKALGDARRANLDLKKIYNVDVCENIKTFTSELQELILN